ncbi:lasso RiPP family leader peptide-containing protein [Pseudaeromonas pectinilytica]
MQNQKDIQNVKTWQAPELIELGDVASDTQNGIGPSFDGVTSAS